MKSRAQLIREWLITQTEPKSGGEIAAAIGMGDDSIKAHWTVSVMYRDGFLDRIGTHRHYRYTVSRQPMRVPLDPEEARRRKRERQRMAGRHKGAKPLEEHLAFLKERAAARKAAKEAEYAQRRDASQKQRAVAKAKAAKIPRPKIPKPRKPKMVLCRRAQVEMIENEPITPAKRELQRMETVEQFMARGGRIDRLPTSWEQQAA